MLFNSLVFLLFAALFFIFFYFIKRGSLNIRWGYFTLASFVFYGWWDWRYLFLLILTGLIDYAAALGIIAWPRWKKALLFLSLFSNLLVLFSFKYIYFFKHTAEELAEIFHISHTIPAVPGFFAVLPIGISFYTFQSMSYTIDVYRNKLIPTKNILHFFAFLSLFPQLVAGPIVRATELLPQLTKLKPVSEAERWHGLRLIAIGFFKKTVLADNIAPFVNSAFSNDLANTSSFYWWVVMLGFGLQIYFDFSGYSDIARGLAKWMGFHFKLNFNHPYLSASFREFWKRWHISLSSWFRDYVYIPLGGARKGKLRATVNLWITMLLSGLWHGAGFNFLIWGALHAFYLTFERFTKWTGVLHQLRFGRYVAIPIVFMSTTLAWVFFRAPDLNSAINVITTMLSFHPGNDWGVKEVLEAGITYIAFGLFIEIAWGLTHSYFRAHRRTNFVKFTELLQVVTLLFACIYLRGSAEQFIYFQF